MDFANEYKLSVIPVVKPKDYADDNFTVKREAYTEDGVIINSEFLNGLSIEDAKKVIIKKLEEKGFGTRKVNYKLRDWGISRQRFWGCPIPIIYREDGEILPEEEVNLPVKLPEIEEFNESSTALSNINGWKDTVCSKTGLKAVRETDTFDTFLSHLGII